MPLGKWAYAEKIPTKGFAIRPGWHAGELPIGKQLRTKAGRLADDRVWAEVELPDDHDWQSEVDKLPDKELKDRVPEGGHYLFREKSQGARGTPWMIGGALRVKKVLSHEEVRSILREAGRADAIPAETRGTFQDKRWFLHFRDQTHVFVEAQHPRRSKGPGGGEFAPKGEGGAMGGAAPQPTMHVHVHQPPPKGVTWTLAKGDPTGKSDWLRIANIAKEKAVAAYKSEHPKSPTSGADISLRINDFMKGAAQDEKWRDWYDRHRPTARLLFGKYEPLFEHVLAITSINNPFKRNVQVGIDVTMYLMMGGKAEPLPEGTSTLRWPTPESFTKQFGYRLLPKWNEKLWELQEKGTVSGLKIGQFDAGLSGNPDAVPIDRHMARFLFEGYGAGSDKKASSVSDLQHAVGQAVVRAWAKELGWGARELQAVTWAASMREQGVKTDTFEDELKKNIERVEGFLKAHNVTTDADGEPGYQGLQDLLKAYKNLLSLMKLFETIREALPGDQLTPENVAKLTGVKLPTQDATTVWVESKHPRRGKGPGGGEFTKGAGGGGGTVNVHVHREMTEPPISKPVPTLKGMAGRLFEPIDKKKAEQLGKEMAEFNKSREPKAGEPGRIEWLVEQTKAREAKAQALHATFNSSIEEPKKALEAQGFKYAEMPKGMGPSIGADDTPPKDPARMMAAAKEYGNAVKTIREVGLDALADEITKNVPVVFSSLTRQSRAFPGETKLDEGTLAMTVSGGRGYGPREQYVVLNANSKPAGSVPLHEYSPKLSVEVSNWKGSEEDKLAFEMQGATIHEFGHVLDNWVSGNATVSLARALEKELGTDWQSKANDYLRKNVSGYAASSPYEATAEAFYIAVVDGPKALPIGLRPWAKRWLAYAKSGPKEL